jgi:lipopolysaccharide transport system ATP-binding protein
MPEDPLVSVEAVSKKFCRSLKRSLWYAVADMGQEITGVESAHGVLRRDEFWAVDGVTFDVCRGQALALVGHNGAGKTTLLRMLNGLIKPDQGRITMRGKVGALIALGAGFNPILTGRENISVNASLLGLDKRAISRKSDEIIDFAELRDFIDAPVQTYSSGMQVRLGFAIATAIEPDVLILDEVLAVGDASFRAKCFKRIGVLAARTAIIFVSHDYHQVRYLCDKALVLERGRQRFEGNSASALEFYRAITAEPVSKGVLHRHEEVLTFSLAFADSSEPFVTQAGGPLAITVDIEAQRSLAVGVCHLNFVSEDGLAAGQIDLTHRFSKIPTGKSRISVKVARLDLAAGEYSINFALFGASGKETLIHAVDCNRVRVNGDPFLWIAYKVPVESVTLDSNERIAR